MKGLDTLKDNGINIARGARNFGYASLTSLALAAPACAGTDNQSPSNYPQTRASHSINISSKERVTYIGSNDRIKDLTQRLNEELQTQDEMERAEEKWESLSPDEKKSRTKFALGVSGGAVIAILLGLFGSDLYAKHRDKVMRKKYGEDWWDDYAPGGDR